MRPPIRLSLARVEAQQAHNYRQTPDRFIHTQDQALAYIEELGFLPLMGISGESLPTLSEANQGWHGLPDTRDDSLYASAVSGWWWGWKETLPAQGKCYYGRILRGHGAFVSWECLPCFLAVARPWEVEPTSPDQQRLLDLLAGGAKLTRELRRAFGPAGRGISRRFHRALASLEEAFLLAVAGGELTGWTMHRWDLAGRVIPAGVMAQARLPAPLDAWASLITRLVEATVISTPANIRWLFRGGEDLSQALSRLLRGGELVEVEVDGLEGGYLARPRWAGELGGA